MIRCFAILLVLAAGLASAVPASARGLPLIRDAEIENTIRAYSAPVFSAIGVAEGDVRVHIVNNRRLNAFVAGGRHIFINTGLLMEADDAGMVIGVLAHEAGHIVAQHLTQLRGAIREAQVEQILTFILAAGAGIATGDGQATGAVASLGSSIVNGTLYRFTRGMETEADEFALATLDRIGISARGMARLMQRLMSQEALLGAQQAPYLRTHPLTRSRLDRIQRHMKESPHTDRPTPARFRRMHTRLRAKLEGFLAPPAEVVARYEAAKPSLPARYALAVAHHRAGRLDRALARIDSLIAEMPRDPYFHELKGQILLERGKARRAARSYAEAVRLAPGEALIRAAYAHALLQTGAPAEVPKALQHLIAATSRDKTFAEGWRLRAIAHGRMKQIGESAAALAEYYLLLRDPGEVRRQVRRAERLLKPGSEAWRRVQDIRATRLPRRQDRR